ncbi:hypothetical protein ACHAWF_004113 [Thalassiosira exigua]
MILQWFTFDAVILSSILLRNDIGLASAFTPNNSNQRILLSAFNRRPGVRVDYRPIPNLFSSTNSDGAENDAKDAESNDGMTDEQLNQLKLSFANMFKSDEKNDAALDASAILTTSRKQKLLREIELLKRLDPEHPENNSDHSDLQNQELVVQELWTLWYGERGPMNERRLRAIEETLVDPDIWPKAEKQYLSLIQEYCGSSDGDSDASSLNLSNWVEPANRLATLLFLMGKYEESKKWCDKILSAKPWHIGALSGVVMICMRMGDKAGVLQYSLQGLPNLTPQMRNARLKWVRQNVQFAEKNLLHSEEMNRKVYGVPDEVSAKYDSSDESQITSRTEIETESDDSDWQ